MKSCLVVLDGLDKNPIKIPRNPTKDDLKKLCVDYFEAFLKRKENEGIEVVVSQTLYEPHVRKARKEDAPIFFVTVDDGDLKKIDKSSHHRVAIKNATLEQIMFTHLINSRPELNAMRTIRMDGVEVAPPPAAATPVKVTKQDKKGQSGKPAVTTNSATLLASSNTSDAAPKLPAPPPLETAEPAQQPVENPPVAKTKRFYAINRDHTIEAFSDGKGVYQDLTAIKLFHCFIPNMVNNHATGLVAWTDYEHVRSLEAQIRKEKSTNHTLAPRHAFPIFEFDMDEADISEKTIVIHHENSSSLVIPAEKFSSIKNLSADLRHVNAEHYKSKTDLTAAMAQYYTKKPDVVPAVTPTKPVQNPVAPDATQANPVVQPSTATPSASPDAAVQNNAVVTPTASADATQSNPPVVVPPVDPLAVQPAQAALTQQKPKGNFFYKQKIKTAAYLGIFALGSLVFAFCGGLALGLGQQLFLALGLGIPTPQALIVLDATLSIAVGGLSVIGSWILEAVIMKVVSATRTQEINDKIELESLREEIEDLNDVLVKDPTVFPFVQACETVYANAITPRYNQKTGQVLDSADKDAFTKLQAARWERDQVNRVYHMPTQHRPSAMAKSEESAKQLEKEKRIKWVKA